MICDHRDKVLALIKETDWIEVKNKDGVIIRYRDTDQGRMLYVEAELNIPPATARRYVTPGGLRDKFLKKKPIKELKVIQQADKYILAYEVIHSALLGIISERDVVSVYGGEDECDFGAYMMGPSIEHPDYPPQSVPVRAVKHISGQLFMRVDGDPNKCVLHSVRLVDLGGMVPVFVIQSYQPKMALDSMNELKQAIANKFHEKN